MDEDDRPAVEEPPRPVAAGVDPRRYYVVIGALLVVIAVLAIRPWDPFGGPAARPTAAPGADAPGAATTPPGGDGPTREPVSGIDAELQVTCGWPSGWRAASLQSWPGRDQPVRSWIAIEPVEADGPLDPDIPFAPIFTDTVAAIGYCAPLGDELLPDVARGTLYAVGEGTATRLAPVVIEPSSPTALGVLWVPGGATASWPPGRYAMEVGGPGYHRWLGIEVEDLAGLRSPNPSPSASPSEPAPTPTPGAGG